MKFYRIKKTKKLIKDYPNQFSLIYLVSISRTLMFKFIKKNLYFRRLHILVILLPPINK